MSGATYTHVGRHAYTGRYAVTADAFRRPGRTHAFRIPGGTSDNPYETHRALCGESVRMRSDDHFMQDEPQIVPAKPGHRVTCKRCRKKLGVN